jgi:hypothetical protein
MQIQYEANIVIGPGSAVSGEGAVVVVVSMAVMSSSAQKVAGTMI